jgi:hypothetical protein
MPVLEASSCHDGEGLWEVFGCAEKVWGRGRISEGPWD